MKTLIVICVTIVTFTATACGDGAAPVETAPTATSNQAPDELVVRTSMLPSIATGPLDASTAFIDHPLWTFLLDTQSGSLYGIEVSPGSIFPGTAGAAGKGTSADGDWQAGVLASGAGGLVFGPVGPTSAKHVSAATYPIWSPLGHDLAFLGNLCREYDVFLLDPVSETLRNLTGALPPATGLGWSPSGSALVLILAAGDTREIALTDLAAGTSRTLLSVRAPGTLYLVEWSPDTRFLVFKYDIAPWRPCDYDYPDYPTRVDMNFGGP